METDKSLYRYPGTKPFEANEYKLFKGRDEDIQKLQELISLQNLIVLYSRSGLGKSSLLNAGLVNKFKEEPGIAPLFVRFSAYYKDTTLPPRERLINIINEEYQQNFQTFLFQKLIPQDQVTMHLLWYLFKSLQISDPAKSTFVIVFDQFEELFTYPESEIEIFKKELSELLFVTVPQQLRNVIKDKLLFDKEYLTKEQTILLYEPLNIKILFAIRSDKLSLLNKLTDYFPSVLNNCYELNPLTREQARQAIVIPATLTDKNYISPPFTYTTDALKLVLDCLTDSGKKDIAGLTASPQEIETFQLQIVCKYVENLVIEKGIKEILPANFGNIKEIFENHYRNIINKLTPANRLPARQLIEEKLIIDGTRVSMPIPFILRDKGMTKELLNELIATHIIRPEQNNTIEISHDTLIEPVLKYYAERKKQEEVENELKEKEAEISRIREQQQKQIEKQRQKAKRNRLFAITVGIFLAFSILLFLYALHQKSSAENQKNIAVTQTKKADSLNKVATANLNIAVIQTHIAEDRKVTADSAMHVADSTLELARIAKLISDKLGLLAAGLSNTIADQKKSKDSLKKVMGVSSELHHLSTEAINMEKADPTLALRLAEVAVGIDREYNLKTGILNTAMEILRGNVFYKTILKTEPETLISSSHDGTKIMTGSRDGEIRIFQIKDENISNTALNKFKLDGALKIIAFSENDEKVLAADVEGRMVLYDIVKTSLKHLNIKRPEIRSITCSNNNIMVVSNNTTSHFDKILKKVEILNLNGDIVSTIGEDITCAVFSPTGDTILTGSEDGSLKMWNVKGNFLKKFSNKIDSSYVNCLAYSNTGTKVLAGYEDGTAMSWEIATGNIHGKLLNSGIDSPPLTIVTFNYDSDEIFTGNSNGDVEWLELYTSNYTSKNKFKGHSNRISSIGIHVKGDYRSIDFFTTSEDGSVRVWHNIEDMTNSGATFKGSDEMLKSFLDGNKYMDALTGEQKARYEIK